MSDVVRWQPTAADVEAFLAHVVAKHSSAQIRLWIMQLNGIVTRAEREMRG